MHPLANVAKNASIAALSQQLPVRLMLTSTPLSRKAAWYRSPVNALPRSEWCSKPASGCLRATANSLANSARSPSSVADMAQPTTWREKRSRMTARDSQPSAVWTALVSVTHLGLGRSAEHSRLSRLAAQRARVSLFVVGLRERFGRAVMRSRLHQAHDAFARTPDPIVT
jgi:hypothetical protein